MFLLWLAPLGLIYFGFNRTEEKTVYVLTAKSIARLRENGWKRFHTGRLFSDGPG